VQETQNVAEIQVPAVQDIQEATVSETQNVTENQTPAVQDIQEATASETQTTPPPPASSDGTSESE